MKKKIMCFLLSFMVVFSFVGCTSDTETEGEYQVYYLNMDKTKIVAEGYDSSGATGEELLWELAGQLSSAPESAQLRQTLPSDLEINSIRINGAYIFVDLSEEYNQLSKTEEVLVRAAIVRTLLQIEECSLVSISVNSEPLRNSDGTVVGTMSADSFIENPAEQINTSVETTLTLYFASSDGTKLMKETRTVHYSTNISMEKLIIEQLIEGPKKSGNLATIPADTKLINVSVVDGVCYVNLGEGFENQNQEVLEEVVLYSIVNSLTEVSNITQVQISINGDTKGSVRYTYPLSKLYERNLSLVN